MHCCSSSWRPTSSSTSHSPSQAPSMKTGTAYCWMRETVVSAAGLQGCPAAALTGCPTGGPPWMPDAARGAPLAGWPPRRPIRWPLRHPPEPCVCDRDATERNNGVRDGEKRRRWIWREATNMKRKYVGAFSTFSQSISPRVHRSSIMDEIESQII
jgi:hypothetical protein